MAPTWRDQPPRVLTARLALAAVVASTTVGHAHVVARPPLFKDGSETPVSADSVTLPGHPVYGAHTHPPTPAPSLRAPAPLVAPQKPYHCCKPRAVVHTFAARRSPQLASRCAS
jgi:hypothetical protein